MRPINTFRNPNFYKVSRASRTNDEENGGNRLPVEKGSFNNGADDGIDLIRLDKDALAYEYICNQSKAFYDDADHRFLELDDETKSRDERQGLTNERGSNHNEDSIQVQPLSSSLSARVELSEGIVMLEPHLAAYRKILEENRKDQSHHLHCDSNSGGEGSSQDSNDHHGESTNNIPPQMLRVVRFFQFKWMKIRRALLRPPSKNEVGIGIRFLLAKELHEKGLLATAEIDILEQSLQSCDIDKNAATSKSVSTKRKRRKLQRNDSASTDRNDDDSSYEEIHTGIMSNTEVCHALKISFSRLPLDTKIRSKTSAAFRLLKSTLQEYYERRAKMNSDTDDTLPSMEDVAEWALISFCSVVISNGVDESRNVESIEYLSEAQLVGILTSNPPSSKEREMIQMKNSFTSTNTGSSTSTLVPAIHKRVRAMLEPPLVDELSNLNVLCLVRLFSYVDEQTTREYIVSSLEACHRHGCGSGLAILPKIIASYVSIVSRRKEKHESATFHASFERGIRDAVVAKQEGGNSSNESQGSSNASSLANIILGSSLYLINEANNRKP
mmetsp:Transcript_9867/g.14834  ORF Transcript_9867/g.14834 Transcript_9867/m.14834 type:complete len:556 (+) Transcript_9867:34-1701(+)|eukprot:CAMPEP_0194085444 /NCGR_PEP_ID=MMETSP0149-20130528/17579_1 /TAXON_ID=122233 /ORGANISM="Chaetoceros debilis, Strain MM31A-1" /LENGTH=555 /DNA_ID=CAMNT_0038768333 /DNA_START=37 /DNA_END=1704 /DNA_ORIENTATION=+